MLDYYHDIRWRFSPLFRCLYFRLMFFLSFFSSYILLKFNIFMWSRLSSFSLGFLTWLLESLHHQWSNIQLIFFFFGMYTVRFLCLCVCVCTWVCAFVCMCPWVSATGNLMVGWEDLLLPKGWPMSQRDLLNNLSFSDDLRCLFSQT